MDIGVVIGISLFVFCTVVASWISLDLITNILKDIRDELRQTNKHLDNIRFSALNDANRTLFDIKSNTDK